jgi:hypothetical protein
MRFSIKKLHTSPPIVMVRTTLLFFSLGTYFIGLIDHKNVHVDTKFVILAITETKIWASQVWSAAIFKKCAYIRYKM